MRKKETIGESKQYQEAMQDLKTRKQLILEARYALQKVLNAERERGIFPSAMTQDILDSYRTLEPVLTTIDSTIGKISEIESRPTSDLLSIALAKLSELLVEDDIDEETIAAILGKNKH